MANLITLIRLILVFVIGAIALYASTSWQLLNVPLVVLNIILDGIDGIIARKRHETSTFGAVFDIAADRIIETTLWLILAELGSRAGMTFASIFELLKKQSNGQPGTLLTGGKANIFYIRRLLWVVQVNWHAGWGIFPQLVGSPGEWLKGSRFFYRD